MRRRSLGRSVPTLLAAPVLASILVLAAGGAAWAAGTRVETLRWAHPDPSDVAGFRVHVGSAPGVYDRSIDVGLPAQGGGVFTYDLAVPSDADVYVAVTAYDADGLASPFSNEQFRAAPQSGSGGGTAPPPGGSSPPGDAPVPSEGEAPDVEAPEEPGAAVLGTPGRPRVVSE